MNGGRAMREKVVVELRYEKFDKCYRVKDDGTMTCMVERGKLLHPEDHDVEIQTRGEKMRRKLTYLEIETYLFSKNYPEAYSKIADVLRTTNPVLLGAITFVNMGVEESQNTQISILKQNIELLKSQDYIEYASTVEALKRNDIEVLRLIENHLSR